MAEILSDAHGVLLSLERQRIADHFCDLAKLGIRPDEVTLIVVLDLRGMGRVVAVEALGEILVLHREHEAASQRRIPTVSLLIDGPGGMQILTLLAPDFVAQARERPSGTIPVLIIDRDEEPGITFMDVPVSSGVPS